ncbi:MAG: RNA polymerase subunit sigma [Deltaproteobacteria bacterium HGW-Deltaproteobacteria-20]|nr:MAG: RNA polymerase subunit sigma [Deltaproteobacteria bacterium HGW-Deltaproteobacteria-20]
MVPWSERDEKAIVERLQARDERAFNELVHQFERRVFGLVFRMLGSREEAEDLAQEVFVQVFKAIDQFRGESKLSTWIYRIAINLCKNRNKYLQRRHAHQQDDIEAFGDRAPMSSAKGTTAGSIARPDDMLVGLQVERIVQDAIQQLEEDFREVLILRDVEDMSYEEIGEITGLPSGTVKSRIHRARERLREAIETKLGEKIG